MVKRRDLNAPPARRQAEVVRELLERSRQRTTGAPGVTDLGDAGDVIWGRGDGTEISVRDVDSMLSDAQVELNTLTEETLPALRVDLDEAQQNIETRTGELSTRIQGAFDAASAAQKKADQGVLDARDAFNAAVLAQTAADDAKNQIAYGGNLVRDPAVTGSTVGWSPTLGNAATDLVVDPHDFGKGVTNALKHTRVSNTQINSDYFPIDPSLAYEIRVTVDKPTVNTASGTADIYFGMSFFDDGTTALNVDSILVSTGAVSTNTNNFYFWYKAGPYPGPQEFVGYVLPMGADPALVKNLPNAIYAARVASPATKRGYVRLLNYDNGTDAYPLWFSNVSVRSFPISDLTRYQAAISAASTAQAKADAASNAVTTAQATADAIRADMAKGPSVWADPSFERGIGPLPRLVAPGASANGAIERVQAGATDGAWAIKYSPTGNSQTLYGNYKVQNVVPGHTYQLSAAFFSPDGIALGVGLNTWDGSKNLQTIISYQTTGTAANAGAVVPAPGVVTRKSWEFTIPEGVSMIRYLVGVPNNLNTSAYAGKTVYLDELRLVDITDTYAKLKAAQDKADAAMVEAGKKATPEQVTAAADAAQRAAIAAAKADATAQAAAAETAAKSAAAADAKTKADQAKADAIAAAATDAKTKADQAKADAVSTAAADAKAKADQAKADAISTAATDAKTKADQAKADVIAAAATDAATKAEAARVAAVNAAKSAADAADSLIQQRAAEDAKAKADAALKAAQDALATARGEITSEITLSANGKNANSWSTSAPTAQTPGKVSGDTWLQVDNLATRNVKGQWVWDGTTWKPVLIRSEVIAALDVAKLTAGTASIATAVVDKLFANIFSAKKIAAGQVDAESVAAAVGTFIKIDVGQIVGVTGSFSDLVAEKIAAATATIQTAYVQNLKTNGAVISEAVIADLAANLITSGMFRTAATGQRLEITSQGIVLWLVDSAGGEYEGVRIGPSGATLITVGDVTIEPKSVTAPTGNFDTLTAGGRDLKDIIAALPKGRISQSTLTVNSDYTNQVQARVYTSFTVEPYRRYRVTVPPFYVRANVSGVKLEYKIVRSWDALGTSWDGTSLIAGVATLDGTQSTTCSALIADLNTSNDSAPRDIHLCLIVRPTGGSVQNLARDDYPLAIQVDDLGLRRPNTGSYWTYGNAGSTAQTPQAPPTTTPPPAVPAKQRFTKNYKAGGSTNYWDSTNAVYSGDVSMIQGSFDGTAGNRRHGAWWFPDMTSDLAGANILDVQIYLAANHTYNNAGGTARIWTHSGYNSANANIMNAWFTKGQGRWLSIGSQYWDSFKNGTTRGFMVLTTSNSRDDYMKFNGGAESAIIQVTYEK